MTAYRSILIDPPWPERGGGKIKRGADKHYSLLKVRDIAPVILSSGMFTPADDSHLYLCVTNNYLEAGLEIVRKLDFRYVTQLTWAKPSFGIGQYFRGQTEHILFAVRGKGLALMRDHGAPRNVSTLLKDPTRTDGAVDWERDAKGKKVHSAKPEALYRLIETCSPAPRLEMFSREPRDGWDVWGNEV